jgi:hypothetical protein
MVANDPVITELSQRLYKRDFYKTIEVTAKLEAAFSGLPPDERDDRRRRAEAKIRVRLADSKLLEAGDAAPKVLDDVIVRDPYRQGQGQGDGAVLDSIYAIDRSGELKDLAKLSRVVEALKKYETYRIYYRESDENTKKALEGMIEEQCHV